MLEQIGRMIGLCALESTVLLLIGLAACCLWRRGSAAQKHLLLSIALVGCLLLPLEEAFCPKVSIPAPLMLAEESTEPAGDLQAAVPAGQRVLSANEGAALNRIESASVIPSFGPKRGRAVALLSSLNVAAFGAVIWMAGTLLYACFIGFALIRLRLFTRKARPASFAMERVDAIRHALNCRRTPDARVHPDVSIPMIFGMIHPIILLPEAAASWPEERLESVLRHEIAHLKRGDLFIQKLMNLCVALYWFHPLVWVVAARLRKEREKACDDLVLTRWGDSSTYAASLLEVVSAFRGRVPVGGIGMARSSQIGARIQSILSSAVNRVAPSRRMRGWMLAIGGGVTLLFGTVRVVGAVGAVSDVEETSVLDPLVVTVKDESGAPVAGAEVAPSGLRSDLDAGSWYGIRTAEARIPAFTDSDGKAKVVYPRFVNEDVPTTTVVVKASHPGFCSSQAELKLDALEPVVLKAGTKVILKAHQGGKPLPMVRADVGWLFAQAKWTAVKDGLEGRVIPPCVLRIVAFDEGGTPLFSKPVVVPDDGTAEKVYDLEVKKGRTLEGRLSDNVPRPVTNGRVVAAVITPSPSEEFKTFWHTGAEIDASGAFVLKDLPDGEVQLIALCDGFASKDPSKSDGSGNRYPQVVDPSSTGAVEIGMEASGVAEVTVLSPKGQPVEGANVDFWPNQYLASGGSPFGRLFDMADYLLNKQLAVADNEDFTEDLRFSSKTDARGVARVSGLPHGLQKFRVVAEGMEMPVFKLQGRTARFQTIAIKPGETTAQTIRMEPEKTSSLKKSIEKEKAKAPQASAKTSGTCELPGGMTGTPLTVAAGSEFTGQVVDEKGKPLEGVLVDAWTWCPGDETKTDAEGRFRLSKLGRDGMIEIRFSLPGYSPRHITQQPVGKVVEPIILSNKTYFEGTITDHSGKPLPGQLVRACTGSKQGKGVLISHVWEETTTDEKGRYRLYVFPDAYEFQVRSSSGEVARVSGQVIGMDEDKRVDIALKPGLTFSARLVDSITGELVKGVRLHHWEQPGIEGTSEADGMIRITGMFPGEMQFNVDAEKAGYRRWWSESAKQPWEKRQVNENSWQDNFDSLTFDVSADSKPVEIVLERGVEIRGIVKDPTGKPVGGATVAPARTGSGNSLTGDTRFSVPAKADGTFRMLLPASNAAVYNIMAHDGKYKEWRKWANGVLPPIQTKPGERLEGIEIRLSEPATIRGRVVDASGAPVGNREVSARAADALENRYYDPTTRTAADGTFELRFLRAGKHYLQVSPFWLYPKEAPPGTVTLVEADPEHPVEGVELTAKER